MPIREYAVLDASGFVISTISVDEEAVNSRQYYPGFGEKLVPNTAAPPPKPADFGLLDVAVPLLQPLTVGDKVDFKTGAVTRKV